MTLRGSAPDGCGVDVTIEVLGIQGSFESSLRVLRRGHSLTSGPIRAICNSARRPCGRKIFTTLCPGGDERMRRLMDVVSSRRTDLKPLATHRFKLDEIETACQLFAIACDVVPKVAITP